MTYWPNPLDGMKMNEETPQSIKAQLKSLSTEPLTWRQAALCVGEHLGCVGPKEYYELSPNDWGVWAANVADHLTAQLAEEKAKSSRLESEVKSLKSDLYVSTTNAVHWSDRAIIALAKVTQQKATIERLEKANMELREGLEELLREEKRDDGDPLLDAARIKAKDLLTRHSESGEEG